MSTSFFCIIPIGLVVWRVGGRWTLGMPVVATIAWYSAEFVEGRVYSHFWIEGFTALTRLAFFLIFAYLLTTLRKNFAIEESSRRQAEEISRLKSSMMGLVSHEYGNMLTHLKLATFLLQQSELAPVPESRADSYEMIERAIEHLRLTTRNFLSLNRLESGQLQLDLRATPMGSVASETLRFMQPLIKAKKLKLEMDFPAAPVSVKADPEALSIIVSNLMTNAIKYTNAGTITVRIARDEGPPPRALFSVQDTGIGISAQDREKVFNGFRTDEGQKVAKGFGLGLRLIKELVERHGSHLEVESESGKGSRFFFYLPLESEP
ncbi:MAG: HAMP domain-containing sensor histidine kinase [Elusimicrobia bacterium]|nr:HAMP domain-containing sensor histidine kinase [Elusimicrobiota bacterium]